MVPRVLVERRRNDLLSGVGEHPHQRTQGVEVRVAPQGETHYPRRGRRMLPEVEVVTPLRRAGQTPLLHAEFEGKFEAFPRRSPSLRRRSGRRLPARRPARRRSAHTGRAVRASMSKRPSVSSMSAASETGKSPSLRWAAARTERVGQHVTHEAGLREFRREDKRRPSGISRCGTPRRRRCRRSTAPAGPKPVRRAMPSGGIRTPRRRARRSGRNACRSCPKRHAGPKRRPTSRRAYRP